MVPEMRVAAVLIAGCVINKADYNCVYDYARTKYVNFSGDASTDGVSVYDYDSSCYITGDLSSLFHYGKSSYFNIEVSGNEFRGYDYHKGNYFSGQVNGKSISFYDYDGSGYHNYDLS